MADIGNLRVLVYNDDGSFFGQGLEIDYFAQGSTLAEMIDHFAAGLRETLRVNALNGHLDLALFPAPKSAWRNIHGLDAYCPEGSPLRVSRQDAAAGDLFPFEGIDFYTMVEKEAG